MQHKNSMKTKKPMLHTRGGHERTFHKKRSESRESNGRILEASRSVHFKQKHSCCYYTRAGSFIQINVHYIKKFLDYYCTRFLINFLNDRVSLRKCGRRCDDDEDEVGGTA